MKMIGILLEMLAFQAGFDLFYVFTSMRYMFAGGRT